MHFKKKLTNFIVQYPKQILLLFCTLFILCALHIPSLIIDNGVDSFLPESNKVTLGNKKYNQLFGPSSAILIAFEKKIIFHPKFLRQLGRLTEKLDKLDKKIVADNKIKNLSRIKSILSLNTKSAKVANNYLQTISASTLTELNSKLTLTEMQMMGIEDQVAITIASTYKNLGKEKKQQLFQLLSPTYVKEAISIVNADYVEGGKDKFLVEKMVELTNINHASIQRIKLRLKRWDIYDQFLVSRDQQSTAIIVRLHKSDTVLYELVLKYVKKEIAASPLSKYKYHIAGEPVVTAYLGVRMSSDLQWLFPIVVTIVMLTLLIAFRHFGAMIIPMIAVLFSTVIVLGLMAISNTAITVVSTVLPVLLIAVGSAYGIHVVNHYQLNQSESDITAVKESIKETFTPVSMAAITTVGGFAALITNQVMPIKNFGLFTAIGVFLAFVFAILLVPALILVFKLQRKQTKQTASNKIKPNKFLSNLAIFTYKKNKLIITVALLLATISTIGIFSLKVDTDMVRMFKPSSFIRTSDRFLNKKYLGTATAEIIIDTKKQNGALSPHILQTVDNLETFLKSKQVTKEIRINFGGCMSVTDYIKKANKAMHNEKTSYYRIPQKMQSILDYMLILKESTSDLCSRDGAVIKVLITMKTGSTQIAKKLKSTLLNYFKKHNIDNAQFLGHLSKSVMVDNLIVKGQIYSMFLSLLVVFLLNWAVFRSLLGAVISIVPLSIAILCNFGLMGHTNILLDIATSMISSIAIGIGIDYTIHFIAGFRSRMQKKQDIQQSLQDTGVQTGRAILYNMVAVMFGFAVLLFSSFVPLINFGLLISITMITTGIASLTLVPSILILLKKSRFVSITKSK